ncbi:MAG: DEAD/DEAH box helicase [Actinomycetota bacterium]|nr:DEAD/DEAH box helicase [Actinomycetota bacterium]
MHQQLARQLDDATLRDAFGTTTFARATGYAATGRVLEVAVDDAGQTLSGVVAGQAGRLYRTTVAVDPAPFGLALRAWCTCPVGLDCKHAAAVLIAARRSAAERAGGPPAAWERSLADVVAPVAPAATPLGLQFEVVRRPARSSPYSSAPSPTPDRRVRLRPVAPGATGAWVRSGVGWQQLRFDYGEPAYDEEQRSVLRELLMASRAAARSPYGTEGDTLYLDDVGRSLWRLLQLALDAGVAFVPARRGDGPVTLSAAPAALALDLRSDHAAGQPATTLARRITLDGDVLDPAAVDLVGAPPHGVAVHSEAGLVLAALERPVQPAVDRLIRAGLPVQIPAPDLDRFLVDYFPRLQRAVAVTSSDGSVPLPDVAPPRLALTVTYGDGHRIAVEWGFEYRVGDTVRILPLLPTAATHARDPAAATDVRDPAAERQLVADLPLPEEGPPFTTSAESGAPRLLSPLILTDMDAVRFVGDVLPRLHEHAGVVVHERGTRPEFRAAGTAPQVRMRATDSDEADWFDLQVSVWVDGEEVPFDALFTALALGQSHLLLPSGTWFGLDRPELQDLRRLIEEARTLLDAEAGSVRASRYQAGFWDELCALGVVEEQSSRWASAVRGLVDVTEVGTAPVPDTLRATLRPYQVEGYRWLSFLWDQRLGGILADDMGLGKTVQTLAMLCRAKEAGDLDAPVLVVAPTSVVRNWVHEAEQFTPELRAVAVTETAARSGVPLAAQVAGADLVVTSYSLFRLEHDAYAALPWRGLVLDEAQFVKNHQAKTYQCARRLVAPFRLAITGTPMENNLMELWALLSIVAPGLFPSPQKFSEFYRRPIERGADPALLASLRRRIRPLMRRRTKEEVAADLPAKQEQVLQVELAPRHRKVYDTHLQRERQKILRLLDDLDAHRFTVLQSLTLLRQLSLDPALVDAKHASVTSAKVEVLAEHLQQLAAEGHRALVFSQFTGFLRRVRDRLDAEGIAYAYLDGRTRNRQRVIEDFKRGAAPVFLISLKAGGVGLNLTEADYCFILDPWWNPATEAQAVDRTHRIGQDKRVVVYRLVSADTIEDKVMALKERKAELVGRVLGDDGALATPLTADDVKALLA